MKTLAVAPQQGGTHYGDGLQPWDLQLDMPSTGNTFLDSRRTDAMEYLFRLKPHPGMTMLESLKADMIKARHNIDAIIAQIDRLEPPPDQGCMAMEAAPRKLTYQDQVWQWMVELWTNNGDPQSPINNIDERCFRFFEEATELVQSMGMSLTDCISLATHVFLKPKGDPEQEVGGVCTTLFALCCTAGFDVRQCAYAELERVKTPCIMDKIRAKHFSKQGAITPLPGQLHTGGDIPQGPPVIAGQSL